MADKLKLDRQAMKDRSTSHLRIYVGGLADKTSVDHLYEHFISYGQINGIVINKNFGFVQFETEESAQDAISNANGSTLQGRILNVRTAQTNFDKTRRETEVVTVTPDKPPAMVLTENLPIAADADSEEQQYDNFGNFIGDQNYRDEEYEENSQYNRNEPSRNEPSRNEPNRNEPSRNESSRNEPSRNESRGGARGRAGRGGRGRGAWGRGAAGGFRERSPAGGRGNDWQERGGYDRYSHPMPEYPRALPVPEKNDCEIIVVSKQLTEYAEYIESRLKRLGIVVDLLYPMEDVPIGKVLGNIASRGCLYAILVMPQNQEHRSLTLTILHGLPQEHRNMPLEDALVLLSRNFQEVQRGGPSGREAVYALLGQLADGRTLTALQYDKVLEYLQERREQQVKLELGEPLVPAPVTTKTQVDLQQRILSILNDKAAPPAPAPAPAPSAPAPAPAPVPAPTPAPAPAQNKLLNDPTVRKALDSILQKFA